MTHWLRCSLLLLVVMMLALATAPAGAVSWLTVNGATSGTIKTPGWMVLRCNTSAVGARIRFVGGTDLNGNGELDGGEPVAVALGSVADGGWTDEDPAAAVVKLSNYIDVNVTGPVRIQAVDDDGSTLGHVYSMDYTHPGQSVCGRVLYEDGTAAAGMMVATRLNEEAGYSVCFTDSSGNYRLYLPIGPNALGLMPDTEVNDRPSPSLRAVPWLNWVTLAAGEAKTGENFRILRASGPYIVGVIREADTGRPIPGIQVWAWKTSSGQFVTTVTDINGEYRLSVSQGSWDVLTERQHYAGPYGTASAQVWVSTSDATLNLSLPRFNARIYGTVTGPGGIVIPGAGAWVYSFNSSTWWGLRAPCNGVGRYEMWVPSGSYTVQGGDTSGNYTLLVSGQRGVTVPPDQQVNFSLVARPYTLSGRVVVEGTTTGVPFAGLSADDVLGDGYDYADWFETTTDGQGYFSLKMPAGTFNGYVGSWLYESWGGPQPLTFPPSLSGVTIELPQNHFAPTLNGGAVSPTDGVSGQVFTFTVTYTSADDDPPADVYVVIDNWPWPMEPVNPGDTNYGDGAVFQYKRTLGAGTHSFWFGALDSHMLEARYPASSALIVTVTQSGVLAGTVRDKDTSAVIAGATAKAYLGASLMGSAATNSSGVYRIRSGLPSGTYSVKVEKPWYVTQTKTGVAVTAGSTTWCNFALVPAGELGGTVRDNATGYPLPGVTVKFIQGGTVKFTMTTGSNGVYRMYVPAGTYNVTAEKPWYVTQTKTGISVTTGATTWCNFALVPAGELGGTVRDNATGDPLPGVTVKFIQGGTVKFTATTGSNGVYRMYVPAGTYNVTAEKPWYVTQTTAGIVVTTGATTWCNFSLKPAGELAGFVRDSVTSDPLVGAVVSLSQGGTVKYTATTDANGLYRVFVVPGTYVVTAEKPGYVTQTKTGISVTLGATTWRNFALKPQ